MFHYDAWFSDNKYRCDRIFFDGKIALYKSIEIFLCIYIRTLRNKKNAVSSGKRNMR